MRRTPEAERVKNAETYTSIENATTTNSANPADSTNSSSCSMFGGRVMRNGPGITNATINIGAQRSRHFAVRVATDWLNQRPYKSSGRTIS